MITKSAHNHAESSGTIAAGVASRKVEQESVKTAIYIPRARAHMKKDAAIAGCVRDNNDRLRADQGAENDHCWLLPPL